MLFEHDDWKDFQSLETLCRKAGASQDKLTLVVAKELADNALDAAGGCEVGLLEDNGFFVHDEGGGIQGDDRAIAALFSINRPLRSSKRLRLPSRGALGNGLRVVAGAVFSSGGSLTVSTRGRTLRLTPQESGETTAEFVGDFGGVGTRVEVRFGPTLDVDEETLAWADEAISLAGGGTQYEGKPSPHWFDSDSFFRLVQDASDVTVRQVIAEFEGCSEPKAGKIASPFGKGRLARQLKREEVERLLKSAREHSRPVNPKRLGCIGMNPLNFLPPYKIKRGTFKIAPGLGNLSATIPYVVEVSAEAAKTCCPTVRISVNRTPITAEMQAYHDAKKRNLFLSGCGLEQSFSVGREPINVRLNIDTPYMPIISDGKAPDLTPFVDTIRDVLKSVGKAAKRQAFGIKAGKDSTQERVIREHLDVAIDKVSGGGQARYSLRQLYYALRPHLIEAIDAEPNYKTFSGIITRVEGRRGSDLPGIYRDSRGTLYHPHTGEQIPLGTLSVEQYRRPEWTFNKILYCEKEGFFPILIAAQWAERHDCALLTSKGFASRAARDVLDLLGDSDKGLQFFCIHDADAYGTRIYQSLQKETLARPGRKAQIINLGLEPWEALKMGLEVEKVNRKGKKLATVGDYVKDPHWHAWLQVNRVELNAMPSPQFLEWLDSKFEPHAGKVIPPKEVIRTQMVQDVKDQLRARITARVLERADVNGWVERAFLKREPAILGLLPTIEADIARHFRDNPADQWNDPLHRLAEAIVSGGGSTQAA